MASVISGHDAVEVQQVVRAMHTAAAAVEAVPLADQLQEWADRITHQIAGALDEEED